MPAIRKIAILTHRYDRFLKVPYLLREIAAVWREQGVEVTVLSEPSECSEADLAILHVDLTVVPPEYVAMAARFSSRILNGKTLDISKRSFSDRIVRRGDGYDGPVIVKTDRNAGGQRETRLVRQGISLRRWSNGVRNLLPWAWRAELPVSQYHVFDSASEVPLAAWFNPEIIVERLICERHEGLYGLRTWVFLGDSETNSLCYAEKPIIKSRGIVRREVIPEVPEELREIRRKLGFDFGKFDYAVVDGRVVLYDTNRTPSLGNFSADEMNPRIRHYAAGLASFAQKR